MMAREFMASHGVDLDHILAQAQSGDAGTAAVPPVQVQVQVQHISQILNARLPSKPSSSTWDISIFDGHIESIEAHQPSSLRITHLPGVLDARRGLLTPALSHAHVHLDKCFLLQDPKYTDLELRRGDFAEAMQVTGMAKARFSEDDLLRRGRRLVNESIEAGVVSMRAFVEVDEIVELKCVLAALKLKEEFEKLCDLQICAFAQLALFSGNGSGSGSSSGSNGDVRVVEQALPAADQRRALMLRALALDGVEAIGSTPYVEESRAKAIQNIEWTTEQASKHDKLLDFHLDYHLDQSNDATVGEVVDALKRQDWPSSKTVCLGHCTRLTLFDRDAWSQLRNSIAQLPVSFVGLPTSDLYMMARPASSSSGPPQQRHRGTLQVLDMIKQHGFDAAIAINNIGNAFTPQGSCDPLSLASLGVAVYHATTTQDADLLFETISSRASTAIGRPSASLHLLPGMPANLTLFPPDPHPQNSYSSVTSIQGEQTHGRKDYTVADLVWLGCSGRRRGILAGRTATP